MYPCPACGGFEYFPYRPDESMPGMIMRCLNEKCNHEGPYQAPKVEKDRGGSNRIDHNLGLDKLPPLILPSGDGHKSPAANGLKEPGELAKLPPELPKRTENMPNNMPERTKISPPPAEEPDSVVMPPPAPAPSSPSGKSSVFEQQRPRPPEGTDMYVRRRWIREHKAEILADVAEYGSGRAAWLWHISDHSVEALIEDKPAAPRKPRGKKPRRPAPPQANGDADDAIPPEPPPRSNHKARHQYYQRWRDLILKDSAELGCDATCEKWDISSWSLSKLRVNSQMAGTYKRPMVDQPFSKTTNLLSGGQLTLIIAADVLRMSIDDRHFVLDILERMEQYNAPEEAT